MTKYKVARIIDYKELLGFRTPYATRLHLLYFSINACDEESY